MTQRLTRKQAAIIGAYFGVQLGPFEDVHEYVSTLPGLQGVSLNGMHALKDKIKEAARADYMSIRSSSEDSSEEKPVVESVKPEEIVDQFVTAVGQEEMFRQAIDSLQPPAEKKDPHAATVRKVLNSVWEAYDKVKQSKQHE